MKCPGQDMQYWDAGAIFDVACPECDAQVEFYKDDTTRSCPSCGHRFVNPKMDFGCAAYCKYAEQCIGTLPEEFVGSQDNLLKDKVAVEMKRFYKTDFKRIGHVSRVARYAEKIGKEEGVNLAVVLCAAYLNDIGQDPEDQNGSKQTSLDIARSILSSLGAKEGVLQEVCALIEEYSSWEDPESPESKALSDAIQLAALEEKQKEDSQELEISEELLSSRFHTESGRELARATFSRISV